MNIETSNQPSAQRQASSSWPIETFKDRDDWIKQILAVKVSTLSGPAKVVATRIAFHLNINTGRCNPASVTLALECGMDERSVRRMIQIIESAGWLSVDRSRGRNSNSFELRAPPEDLRQPGLNPGDKTRVGNSATRVNLAANPGDVCTPTRVINAANPGDITPLTEKNSESITAKRTAKGETPPQKRKVTRSDGRRRQPSTSWPEGLHLTDDMADHAADKAGWEHGRAFAEFERFENYHRSKGSVFANWQAAWRTWVQNGIKFDRERALHRAPVIDQNGNPIAAPPPNRPPPWRRRSNTEFAFEGGDE